MRTRPRRPVAMSRTEPLNLTKLVKTFNEAGEFKPGREVVIAPTALHIGLIKSLIRPDIKLATQNLWKVDVRPLPAPPLPRATVPSPVSSPLP